MQKFHQLKKVKKKALKFLNLILLTTVDIYEYGLVNHAAALAFYFILSIMPSLLLIILSAKNLLTIYPNFTLKILEYINNINPSLSNFIHNTNILSSKGDINYRYVGIFSLILAASLFFRALTRSFDIICKSMKKGFITGFFLPYIYTIITVILIIFITFIHIGSKIFIHFFFNLIPFNLLSGLNFIIESFIIPTFLIFIATFISYYALSFKSIGLKASFYGSLLFSFTLYFINHLFNKLYNPTFYNYLYGSIGYIMILLIWLYTVFILFLYFAAFSYNMKHYSIRLNNIRNKSKNISYTEKLLIKLGDMIQ